PLPHASSSQRAEQPSPSSALPSSHSSPAPMRRSPQRSSLGTQRASHTVVLGGSQNSPGSSRPLPHTSSSQPPLQPSASSVLPSSHSSLASRTALPHTPPRALAAMLSQRAPQVSVFGGSQASPGSTRPFPQRSS